MKNAIIQAWKHDTSRELVGQVKTEQAIAMIREGAILLDVRPPKKLEGNDSADVLDIENARHIPIMKVDDIIHFLDGKEDATIIVSCSEYRASNRVSAYLQALGYKSVYASYTSINEIISELK